MKKRLWMTMGVLFLSVMAIASAAGCGGTSAGESVDSQLEEEPKTSQGAEEEIKEPSGETREDGGEIEGTEEKDSGNGAAQDYIFPDSDSRYLSEDEVRNVEPGKLRIARNELFARHGYIFQDEGLRQYFESQPWYAGTVEAEQFDFDTDLNEYEKKNAELINLVEAEGGEAETAKGEDGKETETAADENGGQEQAANGADAPYLSLEYLKYYLEKYHIEVNEFSERKNIFDFIQSNPGELVYIKEDGGFLKKPYYAMTANYIEFFYQGQMKENKPDGIGAIFKPVYLSWNAESIGESDTADIYESSSMASQYSLALVYAGYFKEGRPEGYGIEFSVPGDEDYLIGEIPINGCQSEADIQETFLEMANPIRYEGEFEEGEYSGRGNEYEYPLSYSDGEEKETFLDEEECIEGAGGNEEVGGKIYEVLSGTNKDIKIYTGTYGKGERNGAFKIYEFGYLCYEGGVKKGKYHGVGTEYYPLSKQVYYEGEWRNGEPHGTGVRYLEDGSIYYSGEWEYGDYAN